MKLDAKQIMEKIPHRFPMLLIDRVLELEPGQRGVGIKCVTINEPYFQGHFAEYPIVPGVLIIESLAQLAAVVFAGEAAGARPETEAALVQTTPAETTPPATPEQSAGIQDMWQTQKDRPGYLAQVEMRYRQPVLPGDVLHLEINLIKKMGRTAKVKAEARVDGKIVAQGEMTFA